MPITLVTGLPGNGKTLYALSETKQRAEKENRPVYYSGIKDLKLPWTEIEAEEWYKVPTGSIVVIDECQRVFRPRMHGKDVPKHVEELETHRHKGIDLVLITQHPMLADSAIRRLTDRHMHIVRTFGTERAVAHEWGSVRENCEKPAGRTDSIKHAWKYPKEVYGWYHSAEVHTVKRRIPMRLIMLCLLPFLLAALVYRVYSSVQARVKPGQQQQQTQGNMVQSHPASMPAVRPEGRASYQDAVADAKQYVYERTPRVTGLDHTAPKYDELTKPTRVPVPAACMHTKNRCQCYSHQATKLDVSFNMCVEIARNGYFQEFDAERDARDNHNRQQSMAVLDAQSRLPISGASTKDVMPSSAAADGYGVLGKAGPGVRVPGTEQNLPIAKPAPGNAPSSRIPNA